jgi:hypothetical protein
VLANRTRFGWSCHVRPFVWPWLRGNGAFTKATLRIFRYRPYPPMVRNTSLWWFASNINTLFSKGNITLLQNLLPQNRCTLAFHFRNFIILASRFYPAQSPPMTGSGMLAIILKTTQTQFQWHEQKRPTGKIQEPNHHPFNERKIKSISCKDIKCTMGVQES